MKRNITLGLIGWFIATLGSLKAAAQETTVSDNKKETQEITIRKKGDKDTKVTVEITGDKVLINGKPIAEFNEEGITVNNRKMIIREGNNLKMDIDGKMFDLNNSLRSLENLKLNFDNDVVVSGYGKSDYTYMGVNTEKKEEGALIKGVTKDSPAEKAGLQKGDIIYKIDDEKIENSNDLSEYVRAKKDGDKVKVYYLRDGKKKNDKVTLATNKNSWNGTYSFTGPDGRSKSITVPDRKFAPDMRNLNGDIRDIQVQGFRRQKLGLKIQDTEESTGVKVLDVEAASAAATAGLMKDDVITEIEGAKITNTDEAREQLQAAKDKTSYVIKAKRSGSEMTFTIKIPKNLKTTTL